MSKCLLTGGSGRLGKEIRKLMDVYAPTRGELDIQDIFSVTKCKRNNSFDCVIHCAAFTDVPGTESRRQDAILTNIIGTKNITTTFCDSRIIYISTDYVYPGITGNYKETDKEDPFNFYGFTKLGGEAFIDHDKDLIIRTSFKPNDRWPYPKAFIDLFTSADYVDIIAKDIVMLIESNLTGIINVGTERKSVYDLAKRRNQEIAPMSVKEVVNVNMPSDISMDLSRLNKFKLAAVK